GVGYFELTAESSACSSRTVFSQRSMSLTRLLRSKSTFSCRVALFCSSLSCFDTSIRKLTVSDSSVFVSVLIRRILAELPIFRNPLREEQTRRMDVGTQVDRKE